MHLHCTKEVTRSEGREGPKGIRGRKRVGSWNGDRKWGEDGAGTRTGAKTTGRTQDGNEHGNGHEIGDGKWTESGE